MKKLASALSVLALLATMTFGFSSCQQQNQPSQPTQTDPTKTEEPSLVGEWKVLVIDFGAEQYPGQGMSFTFLENGTFIMTDSEGAGKGTYTLVGKSLILEANGDAMKFTIKELTKNSLVLRQDIGSGEYAEYTCQRVN
ncbi:MAG: lipocalin family protein [Paludibacteraceae bacterium]|nr:lipocalin family protein [Paludibacteraceae bacterium]MBQ6763882.1 lipocalin family protein [Paludibacteraceae bacterium]